MKLFCTLLLMFLSAVSADAARMETSTRCVAGPSHSTGRTSCMAAYPFTTEFGENGSLIAYATSRINQVHSNKFETYAGAETWPDSGIYSDIGITAHAEATSLFRAWGETEGPVRPGWIELDFRFDSLYDAGGGEVMGIIGPYTCRLYNCVASGRYPFLLGVPFLVQLSVFAEAETDSWGNSRWFSGGGWMQFLIGDESTGQYVHWGELSVPEPGGTSIGGLSALLLLYLGRLSMRYFMP